MVVGVAELKAKLSELLARVRAGDELVITEHGRPVARIVPITGGPDELAELERQGLLRRGRTRLPRRFLEAPRPKVDGAALSESVIDERREGR